jgi:twitching motility protein PilT
MIDLNELLILGRSLGASDLHLSAGEPPVFRQDGALKRTDMPALSAKDTELLARQIKERAGITGDGIADFAFADESGRRQRVNVYKQMGTYEIAIRFLGSEIPTVAQLGLPPILETIADEPRGLVLVTGPTGSGKSTTLAAMLDYINRTRFQHILTLEDPVEYVYINKKCLIHQIEIGKDTDNFSHALRYAPRQNPDIILVGEMRDPETIAAALTAAETGHLVFSTLHTTGAPKTIDRIIDTFEPYQQQQVRTQLSTSLRAVISQRLVPRIGGGRVAVHEIMLITPAIANLIREGKVFQIYNTMQTSGRTGMISMDASIANLVKTGVIARETAEEICISRDELKRLLNF